MSYSCRLPKIEKFTKAGVSASKIKLAEKITERMRKAEEVVDECRKQWDTLEQEMNAELKEITAKQFAEKYGLKFGEAYVATPRFAGKVINIIPTEVQFDTWDKRAYYLCAVVSPSGKILKTDKFFPEAWNIVPAQPKQAKTASK